MIDESVTQELSKLKGQIKSCVEIYSDELKRRSQASGKTIIGLAPAANIVYGFMYPRAERDFCTAAIEALLQTDAVRTLLLPGVQSEIEKLYRAYVLRLGEPLYRGNFNPNDAITKEGRKQIIENLKHDVSTLCVELANAYRASGRLSRFLSSPHVDPESWSQAEAAAFETSDTDVQMLFTHLSAMRPGFSINNMVDSQNLAAILSASRQGVRVPLVTESPLLLLGFERLRPLYLAAEGLIIGPFAAVTLVSLLNASTDDIRRLRNSASELLARMEWPQTNYTTDLLVEFNELMQMIYRLAEIGSLINRTWLPPVCQLPEGLDLKSIAYFALMGVETLTKSLANMSKRFGFKPVERTISADVLERTSRNAKLNVELLKDIQRGDVGVIIQKLVILHQGAQMSEYNTNQTGNNLTAIVDSFKTTQLIGSGLSNEVELHIKALLDGVLASHLPEEQKKDVVEAATTVVEGVKKDGRLAGKAKMLWNGLREIIQSVPAALEAWDALQKHWH